VKDTPVFIPSDGKYGQGATYFKAPNPDFGISVWYYLKDVPKTLKLERKEKEKELFKDGKPIPQPSYEQLKNEENEIEPYLVFTFYDESDNIVRKVTKSASNGINKIIWDCKYESLMPVNLKDNKFDPLAKQRSSSLVMPGKYKVAMSLVYRNEEKLLTTTSVEFNVYALSNVTLPASNRAELVAFQKSANELARNVWGVNKLLEELNEKTQKIKQTINNFSGSNFDLMKKAQSVSDKLSSIDFILNGEPAKASDEEIPPAQVPLNSRLYKMISSHYTTSNVTKTQKTAYEILREEIKSAIEKLYEIKNTDLKNIETELDKTKAPYTPGRIIEVK